MKYLSLILIVFLVGCVDATKTDSANLATEGTSFIDTVSDFGGAAVDVVSGTVDVVAEDVKNVGDSLTGPVGVVATLAMLALYARKKWRIR